jgi:hypothetical protein
LKEEQQMPSMFEMANGGLGVMPDPADNPNNHVVPSADSGTRVSFETLSVGDAGGTATVSVELDGAPLDNWTSGHLDPGEREVGYVSLGRLAAGDHTVIACISPGSGQQDQQSNTFSVE